MKKKKRTTLLSKAWKVKSVISKTKKIKKLEQKLNSLKRERLRAFKKALKRLS